MSIEETSAQNPRSIAGAPFHDPSHADIIICSSDGVDFYVYQFLVSLVMPFFRNMFSLAYPEIRDNLPFVDVSETSATLTYLLSFVDPRVLEHQFNTTEEAGAVLDAAEKYELDGSIVEAKIASQLLRLAATEPMEVYLMASSIWIRTRRSWATKAAHVAARRCCHLPPSEVMKYRSGPDTSHQLLCLTRFLELCTKTAKELVQNPVWLYDEVFLHPETIPYCGKKCKKTGRPLIQRSQSDSQLSAALQVMSIPHWLVEYIQAFVRAPLSILANERIDRLVVENVNLLVMATQTSACMEGIALARGHQWLTEFNHALREKIIASLEKIDLGLEDNCMPFARSD